jgi:hypothetical protein
MKSEFSGGNELESGQRFLDGSVPRLIRHVASCETAVGKKISPTAGKDKKLSRGVGRTPAFPARIARVSSSLDSIQINRDRPKGWKRNRGAFTVRGASIARPEKVRYCRVGCKCWACTLCGPRRAAQCRIRITKTAERYQLNKLLTLTLDPSKLNGQESTKYINEVFADFRVYLRRKLGYAPAYIRILEYQKNGNAHLHILLGCYLEQAWMSEVWSAVGGGRIVDIKRVDMHRISHYLSKYFTKDMLLCAPKRARHVTTSKGIRLFEKQPVKFTWQMIRIPILRLFDIHRAQVTRINPDKDGYLITFETLERTCEITFSPGS